MSQQIDLRPEDRKIVVGILREHVPAITIVYVFGSRARGTTRRTSDLDLAIDAGGPLTRTQASDLADAFEDSDLPYKVDIVDLHQVRQAFHDLIVRDMEPLDLTEAF
jgi:predicted nucleotidyltransferase